MTLTEQIDEAKAKLACLERVATKRAEQESIDNTDWSKVKRGTLVIVRQDYDPDDGDPEEDDWQIALFGRYMKDEKFKYSILQGYDPDFGHDCGAPYKYKYCRLYEGPGAMVWHDWAGGECPIPEGKWCITVAKNGAVIFYGEDDHELHDEPGWEHVGAIVDIIKYMIIAPPSGHGGGDE